MTAAKIRPALDAEDLLATVLAGVPRLTDPACRGQAWLFDDRTPDEPAAEAEYRHHQAVAICSSCPALETCKTWVSTLPPNRRPAGVVAGQRANPRPAPGRPRKETVMTDNDPQLFALDDSRRAAALLLHYHHRDAAGVNQMIGDAVTQGRTAMLIVALCDIAFTASNAAPLNTPGGIAGLQAVAYALDQAADG